ncbi:ABC transporter substrate-binding protein [Streptomyces sp. NPDC053755]|uniref:ABC transporter substrate-binding protein n=1 Tax=Streptomyces sp. NPDC053755 TaxID=3155815 RepID=UPI00341A228A
MGRYRILARLGAGGMGRVYLGRSTSGRMVAVKVVRAELAEDPEFRRRFAREVEAARRVTGFFTAAVVDADPEGAPAWLATAYVPGMPLDEAVRAHGAWPRHSLLLLGAGLVEALEAIHGAGLIHRDLKPSNVLIAADGPRVIDFGISVATEATALTQTGMVIGTPGFMSPEQVTGRAVGPAGDLFSLGAVLAFAATGAGPFGIGSPHSVNFRAVYEEPDLHGLPAGTDFVARCLAKEPERRPTVPELLAELGQLLGEAGGQTLAGHLPKETDWLPAAVAEALTSRAGGFGAAPGPPAAPDPRLAHRAAPAGGDDRRDGGGEGESPSPAGRNPEDRGRGVDESLTHGQDGTPTRGAVETPETVPTENPPVRLDKTPTPHPAMPPRPAFPPDAPQAADVAAPARAAAPPVVIGRPLVPPPVTVAAGGAASTGPVVQASAGAARFRRRLVAVSLAVVLAAGGGGVVLWATQNKDKPVTSTTGGGGAGGSTSAAGFDAAIGGVVNASTKKGGTLRLWSTYDADSWDPARSYYGWVWNMQRFYARTLYTYDARPGSKGKTLVPDLAEAAPVSTDGGRTYTVRLKRGLTFEDGSAITAKDVEYGIARAFAQDVVPGGPLFLVEALDQGQDYPGPYKDSAANGLGLRSVRTVGDSTLVFTLAKPDSDFPHLLAMGATAPVPRERDTGARYGEKPVSSGPYRFDSYVPGKSLTLVRNDHWDPATDPLRKALPDKVELTISGNAEEVDARLIAGTADLSVMSSGLSPASRARVLRDPKLKENADNPHTGYVRYVALASKVKPLDNIHCRKAVLYAADLTALATARGGPAAGSRQSTMLPPTIAGSDGYDPFGRADGKPRTEKAKEELRACGKPGGFTTTLALRGDREEEQRSAVALQSALAKVGITVRTAGYDAAQRSAVVGTPSVVRSKGYGLTFFGWGADYPTGSGFLEPLADGRLILPSANFNFPEVDDPEIDALFDQGAAATDPAAAAETYRRIDHKVVDGAYYLPIVADKAVFYRNPRLTNVYVHEVYGMADFQALGVSDGK